MSITLQYFIIGMIVGLCVAYVIRAVRRRLRNPGRGCADCSASDCPLRRQARNDNTGGPSCCH